MAHNVVFIAGRIGRKKGEGKAIFILPVFHQMEENPLRHPQLLAFFRQIELHGSGIFPDLPGIDLAKAVENTPDPLRIDVLRPDSEWYCQ